MIALSLSTGMRRSLATFFICLFAVSAHAQGADVAMRQAIASEVSSDRVLKAFYEPRSYQPLWVGKSSKEKKRLKDFLAVLGQSGNHGLPAGRYDAGQLSAMVKSARTATAMGQADATLSRAFLAYAKDVQSGVLVPSRTIGEIHRNAPRRDPLKTLIAFSKSSPKAFLKSLPPQTAEYSRLMTEKLRLEKVIGRGGWGPKVPGSKLEYGQTGNSVVALRNRLIAMGYAKRSSSATYDDALRSDVAGFQGNHGLLQDGVAGKGTLTEINLDPSVRLQQVIVAMERERWMNYPLGKRHIWVNITDFTARVMDNGKVTFETRTVVGKNRKTHRTPEFSDEMEFIVINPTWNVPRSITTREYLPMLQANPNAVSHLQLLDQSGNQVQRASVDFASYTQGNFPYRLKEPPSAGNALGKVKFMFPNQHNIYLHDTPSKSLFAREQRSYSHGCIRLGDPFDFAYTLLAKQTGNPQSFFKARLDTRRETVVTLDKSVPVHLVYRTAFTQAKGPTQFRRDVYGRDVAIFDALARAGVSLRSVGG